MVWFNQKKVRIALALGGKDLALDRFEALLIRCQPLSPDVLGVGRLYSDFLNGRPYNDS